MQLPALRLASRWFDRQLIRAVAMTLLALTPLLGVRYWYQRGTLSQSGERSDQLIDSLEQGTTWLIATAVFIVFVAGGALGSARPEARRSGKGAEEKPKLQGKLKDVLDSENKWRAVFE